MDNQQLQNISDGLTNSPLENNVNNPFGVIHETDLGPPTHVAERAMAQIGLPKIFQDVNTSPIFKIQKVSDALSKKDVSNQLGEIKNTLQPPGIDNPALDEQSFHAVNDKIQKYQLLKGIEKLRDKTDGQLESKIKSFADPYTGTPQDRTPITEQRDLFNELKDKLRMYNIQPEAAVNLLSSNTNYLSQHAPQIAGSLVDLGSKAMGFLNSKMPQKPDISPLQRSSISDKEVGDFHRYYDALNNPMGVIDKVKNGSVSNEAIEAIKTVMPRFHEQASRQMLLQVAENGLDIPYQVRRGISKFIGTDLDGSNNPISVASNQQMYSAPSRQADNQGVKPSQNGLSKLTLAERSKTPLQQSAERGKNV